MNTFKTIIKCKKLWAGIAAVATGLGLVLADGDSAGGMVALTNGLQALVWAVANAMGKKDATTETATK